MADLPYTIFHKEKVSLCLLAKFIPKAMSEFHMNQTSTYWYFFQNLMPLMRREGFVLQMSDRPQFLSYRKQKQLEKHLGFLSPQCSDQGITLYLRGDFLSGSQAASTFVTNWFRFHPRRDESPFCKNANNLCNISARCIFTRYLELITHLYKTLCIEQIQLWGCQMSAFLYPPRV